MHCGWEEIGRSFTPDFVHDPVARVHDVDHRRPLIDVELPQAYLTHLATLQPQADGAVAAIVGDVRQGALDTDALAGLLGGGTRYGQPRHGQRGEQCCGCGKQATGARHAVILR
jgi:hypothetical protein